MSLPAPDFHAFKCICGLIVKKSRDVTSADLPGFFLHAEQEKNERILLKLTGTAALLLVEPDQEKWKKHLFNENDK